MTVLSRFPDVGPVRVGDLLADAVAAPAGDRLTVGDPRISGFLHGVSARLLSPAVARRHPELASLGFFLRRAALRRVRERMAAGPDGALVFPRGLVFHVPPANVDTMFVYSWALSALAGNTNIVRVSPRATDTAEAVLTALRDALAGADPEVARTQRMITYGHDDEVTAQLSAACDLRVIWGGDAAVDDIRRHRLAPGARDLTFPDRYSFAVIGVAGWQRATPADRRAAVDGFGNDAYWFDQAACSSPRAVFLVGDEDAATAVRAEFLTLLAEVVARRSWRIDAAGAVHKRVAAYGLAAEDAAGSVRFLGNEIAALELRGPHLLPRRWLGPGTFPFVTVRRLADLAPIVQRADQTLCHTGLSRADLVELARVLGGRGIDRMVPFGAALRFTDIWDGYDLPRELTRLVTVET